jgi:arabinofuranosyltransferase
LKAAAGTARLVPLMARSSVLAARLLTPALLVGVLATALLSVSAYSISRRLAFGAWGIDDANIVFVYARNLTLGRGFVYAPGGPSVEGFSSPLWLAVCTLASFLPPGPEPWLLALSLALAVGSMVCVFKVQERQLALLGLARNGRLGIGATLAWVGLSPLFTTWQVLSLMDTACLTFLVTLALLILSDAGAPSTRALRLALLAPWLVLCRPEGFVWALFATACFGLLELASGVGVIDAGRRMLRPLLATLATIAVYASLRYAVFGTWVANAVLAKQSIEPAERVLGGAGYTVDWFLHHPPAVLVLPFVAPALWCVWRRVPGQNRGGVSAPSFGALTPMWYSGLFVLLGVLLPIASGGDNFNGYRLSQPVFLILLVPLLTCASLAATFVRVRWLQPVSAGLVACLFLLGGRSTTWAAFLDSNDRRTRSPDPGLAVGGEFWITQDDREHGRQLSRVFAGSLPRIGYAAAGGIAYAYAGAVIDLMGLNERSLAESCAGRKGPKGHACFDLDTFYRLAPEALLPRAVPAGAAGDVCRRHLGITRQGSWDAVIFRDVFKQTRFLNEYALARVRRLGVADVEAQGYFRRTFLDQLSHAPEFAVAVTKWSDCQG